MKRLREMLLKKNAYCPNCSQLLDSHVIQPEKGIGWCSNCRKAFQGPARAVPGWVWGVVVMLLTILQFNL
jgi:ribosomal protein L37AE/L43A